VDRMLNVTDILSNLTDTMLILMDRNA